MQECKSQEGREGRREEVKKGERKERKEGGPTVCCITI
jgi:hypothetical protein